MYCIGKNGLVGDNSKMYYAYPKNPHATFKLINKTQLLVLLAEHKFGHL